MSLLGGGVEEGQGARGCEYQWWHRWQKVTLDTDELVDVCLSCEGTNRY